MTDRVEETRQELHADVMGEECHCTSTDDDPRCDTARDNLIAAVRAEQPAARECIRDNCDGIAQWCDTCAKEPMLEQPASRSSG